MTTKQPPNAVPEWLQHKSAPTTPQTTTEHTPTQVAVAPVEQPLPLNHRTAKDFAGALGNPSDDLCLSVIKTAKGFTVNLFGVWTGKEIRGLIRAIENQYKTNKHNMTRKAVQEAASAVLRPTVMSKKGAGDEVRN